MILMNDFMKHLVMPAKTESLWVVGGIIVTPKLFLKEVQCVRILRCRDQQVNSSAATLYVLEKELMNKLTSKVQ